MVEIVLEYVAPRENFKGQIMNWNGGGEAEPEFFSARRVLRRLRAASYTISRSCAISPSEVLTANHDPPAVKFLRSTLPIRKSLHNLANLGDTASG